MNVRFVRSVLAAALLCLGCASAPTQAASINGIEQVVVCDPANPANCMKPAADGSIPTTGSSGGGGDASAANQTSQITQETAINTVLGTKTDAKSTATDATSVSQMQVLKQVSASDQLSATALGAPGDTACASDNGTCSAIALIKRGNQNATTLNTTAQTGTGATASSVPASAVLMGGRAATAAPTAVTDGQLVAPMMGAEGKQVVLPYSIKELAVRGTTTSTDTSAHTIIASAGGSLKNYITALQCGRTDAGATAIVLTLSDAASTVVILPSGGATNIQFPIPLATAAATAFQVTSGTGVSTLYCSAQGYTGL